MERCLPDTAGTFRPQIATATQTAFTEMRSEPGEIVAARCAGAQGGPLASERSTVGTTRRGLHAAVHGWHGTPHSSKVREGYYPVCYRNCYTKHLRRSTAAAFELIIRST